MPESAISREIGILRSLAARGDLEADLIVRTFDAMRSGQKLTSSARFTSTANRALTGAGVTNLDGTSLAGDIVLLKNQTDAKENGLWVVAAGAWSRVVDDNGDYILTPGMIVVVREGSTLADTMWECTSDSTVVGTDNIVFSQLTTAVGAGSISATELGSNAVTTAKINANAVTYPKLDNTIYGVAQNLSGAGAVDVTHRTTKLTSTGAAQAITLANGTATGQRKTIIHSVDGGSMVLTPATPVIFATIVFTNVRDWAELEWNGTGWDLVAFGGATFT